MSGDWRIRFKMPKNTGYDTMEFRFYPEQEELASDVFEILRDHLPEKYQPVHLLHDPETVVVSGPKDF